MFSVTGFALASFIGGILYTDIGGSYTFITFSLIALICAIAHAIVYHYAVEKLRKLSCVNQSYFFKRFNRGNCNKGSLSVPKSKRGEGLSWKRGEGQDRRNPTVPRTNLSWLQRWALQTLDFFKKRFDTGNCTREVLPSPNRRIG